MRCGGALHDRSSRGDVQAVRLRARRPVRHVESPRAGAPLRRRAGRADPLVENGACAQSRSSTSATASSRRRRAGAAVGRLPPGYAQNHRFYVDYTDRTATRASSSTAPNGARASRVDGAAAPLRRQPFAEPQRRPAAFGPDGRLYVGMGDGARGDPGQPRAEPQERLGKLLRSNATAARARWRIVAYGLRNPWRFSFDRRTATSRSATSARTPGRRSTTAARAARPRQLRLERLGGARTATRRSRSAPRAARAAGRRVQHTPRLLRHRRLRLPRPRRSRARRALLLRRLLLGHDLEPENR